MEPDGRWARKLWDDVGSDDDDGGAMVLDGLAMAVDGLAVPRDMALMGIDVVTSMRWMMG